MEVFLKVDTSLWSESGLLHVRGGVSGIGVLAGILSGPSPRPWRCFFRRIFCVVNYVVFSTSVEVFLLRFSWRIHHTGLLHVRGGVSLHPGIAVVLELSSPRPWRCFQRADDAALGGQVFSTSVEVFLRLENSLAEPLGLLHVRGGVSAVKKKIDRELKSSPRPWRCFFIGFIEENKP